MNAPVVGLALVRIARLLNQKRGHQSFPVNLRIILILKPPQVLWYTHGSFYLLVLMCLLGETMNPNKFFRDQVKVTILLVLLVLIFLTILSMLSQKFDSGAKIKPFIHKLTRRWYPSHPHLIELDDFMITTKGTVGNVVIARRFRCLLCDRIITEYDDNYVVVLQQDYAPVWMNDLRKT